MVTLLDLKVKGEIREKAMEFLSKIHRSTSRGQVLIEYLLMTVMLLFLFTGLYRVLQGQLRLVFEKAGIAILTAYY